MTQLPSLRLDQVLWKSAVRVAGVGGTNSIKHVNSFYYRLANWLLPVFVDGILLEHNHVHLSVHC